MRLKAGGLHLERWALGACALAIACASGHRNVESVVGSSPPQAIYGRSLALVVGIDQYRDLPNLGGAVRDAQRMARALAAQGFQVTTLLDAAATREQISETLAQSLPAGLERDSRVVVYFAGHGATLGSPHEPQLGYLVPVDAKRALIASNGISMDEVQRWFALYKAKHIMLVVDACYSGLALPQTRDARIPPSSLEYLRTITKGRARTTLVAGTNEQVAHEVNGVGVFGAQAYFNRTSSSGTPYAALERSFLALRNVNWPPVSTAARETWMS